MLTKEQVKAAHERNLLVFDIESDSSVLTERLMKLMAEVCGYNQIRVDTIYVPDCVPCKMVEGWKIIKDSRLNPGGEFYEYLENELNNSRCCNENRNELTYYVVATGDDTLLGNC